VAHVTAAALGAWRRLCAGDTTQSTAVETAYSTAVHCVAAALGQSPGRFVWAAEPCTNKAQLTTNNDSVERL